MKRTVLEAGRPWGKAASSARIWARNSPEIGVRAAGESSTIRLRTIPISSKQKI
jgi:hypothetical protein